MIQFDEHIFQMGWFNHQLVDFRVFFCVSLGNRDILVVNSVNWAALMLMSIHEKRMNILTTK